MVAAMEMTSLLGPSSPSRQPWAMNSKDKSLLLMPIPTSSSFISFLCFYNLCNSCYQLLLEFLSSFLLSLILWFPQEGSKSGPRRNIRLLKANYIKEFSFLGHGEDPIDLKKCYLDINTLRAREELAIRLVNSLL